MRLVAFGVRSVALLVAPALVLILSGCAGSRLLSDDIFVVKAALEEGQSPNAMVFGISPLVHHATARTRAANGSLRDPLGGNSEAKRIEIFRALLDAGADPNAFSTNPPESPLMSASRNCLSGLVGLLLERGADPLLSRGEATALSATLLCSKVIESERIAGMLLDHVVVTRGREALSLYVRQSAQGTPDKVGVMAAAVWLDNRGVLAALLARGVEVNERGPAFTDKGWTPMHWAMAFGNIKAVSALYGAGADVRVTSEKGATPEDVIGLFLPDVIVPQFAAGYLSIAAKIAISKDVNALVKGGRLYADTAGRLAFFQAGMSAHRACDPPPPGWNGLEEALKKRAALTAKPAGSTPSKTPARPSPKPAYMTAPSAR